MTSLDPRLLSKELVCKRTKEIVLNEFEFERFFISSKVLFIYMHPIYYEVKEEFDVKEKH